VRREHTHKYWNALGILLAFALTALMILGFILNRRQRFTSSGIYRREYEGRIVEKFLIPHDSPLGSSATRAFLITGRGGEKFQVIASPDIYDSAKVGMWVKSSKTGIELSWP
jgi:hypothetical protein